MLHGGREGQENRNTRESRRDHLENHGKDSAGDDCSWVPWVEEA